MSKSLFESTTFKLGCNAEYKKVELGLISDVGMYLFLEEGMRGGVSYISK